MISPSSHLGSFMGDGSKCKICIAVVIFMGINLSQQIGIICLNGVWRGTDCQRFGGAFALAAHPKFKCAAMHGIDLRRRSVFLKDGPFVSASKPMHLRNAPDLAISICTYHQHRSSHPSLRGPPGGALSSSACHDSGHDLGPKRNGPQNSRNAIHAP